MVKDNWLAPLLGDFSLVEEDYKLALSSLLHPEFG
jgi:hypothetical protein